MSANPKKTETSQIDLQQDTSQVVSLQARSEAPCENNAVDVKVSIIIPVYNTAEYLPQCLESAMNQTLKEIEIIVIDDASTDNSLQIIRHYESLYDRMKVIAFAVNRGNILAGMRPFDTPRVNILCFWIRMIGRMKMRRKFCTKKPKNNNTIWLCLVMLGIKNI